MRRLWIGAALALSIASSGSAQQSATPAPAAAAQAAEDPLAVTQARLLATQQQLLAAREQIATLQRQAADAQDQATLLAACRDKNGRLVEIGNALIAAYGQRYRHGNFVPFDLNRRKFEAELQDIGDRVYDNKVDAGPRRAPPPPESSAAPGEVAVPAEAPADPVTEPPSSNP